MDGYFRIAPHVSIQAHAAYADKFCGLRTRTIAQLRKRTSQTNSSWKVFPIHPFMLNEKSVNYIHAQFDATW